MAAVAGVIGFGLNAFGKAKAGREQKKAAQREAAIMNWQADQTIEAGTENQNAARRQLRQILGKQRAVIGANNVQNMGSVEQVQEDTAAAGEIDIANIRNQAALDAYGLRMGAKNTLASGRAAERLGYLGAAGTLFEGYAYGRDKGLFKRKPAPPKTASILNLNSNYSGFG